MVHQLEVEVRLGGVARVPALGDLLAGRDPLALGHPERAAAEVGEHGVHAAAEVEHHVVAEDPAGPGELAQGALGEQVEQARPGAAAAVVPLAAVGPDDRPVGRGQDRPSEAGKSSGGRNAGPAPNSGRDPSAGSCAWSIA